MKQQITGGTRNVTDELLRLSSPFAAIRRHYVINNEMLGVNIEYILQHFFHSFFKTLLLDKSKQNTSKAMNSNKTTKQVLAENSSYKTLINAVIRQLGGTEDLENIRQHGIQGGYAGFTWYSDTVAFANRHRSSINRLLEQQADDMGEDVVTMVSSFGVFRNSGMDAEDKKDLYRFLGGGKCKETTIPNLMAWFAAEEVARMFENE